MGEDRSVAKRGRALRTTDAAGIGMVLAGVIAAGASAAEQLDPTWPCQQAKVPKLSVAQMWSGPTASQDWGTRIAR